MDKNSLTKIADLVRIYPYKKGIGQGYLVVCERLRPC